MDKKVNHLGFIGKHHPLSCGAVKGKKSHGSGLRQQDDIIELMQHGGDVV